MKLRFLILLILSLLTVFIFIIPFSAALSEQALYDGEILPNEPLNLDNKMISHHQKFRVIFPPSY